MVTFRCISISFLLLPSLCLSHSVAAESPSYESVAVVPLPLSPEKDLLSIVAALDSYSNLNSSLVDTQVALWLQKLSVPELQKIQASIPTPWRSSPLVFEAREIDLTKRITAAISSHPALTISPDDPLTAIEAGRVQGRKNWKAATTASAKIADEKIREQFLLGIRESAGSAYSYAEAEVIREVALVLLSPDHPPFPSSQEDEWKFLWPAKSIAQCAFTKSEDARFSLARDLVEHADQFCATLDEATALLSTFGSKAQGQSPLVPEAMGWVLAARDPEAFLTWWEALPQNHQEYAIGRAIHPLLRHDPSLIGRVLSKMSKKWMEQGHNDSITQAWYEHDPAAALEYFARKPEFAEHIRSWLVSVPYLKTIPPVLAIELLNRYPGLEEKLTLRDCFDPLHQKPADLAQELLKLQNPKLRNSELLHFARKWGYQDGAAALAWAKEIPTEADRKIWVRGVFGNWKKKDPEAADKAAATAPELEAAERTVSQAIQVPASSPARYVKPSGTKVVPLRQGVAPDEAKITSLRNSLAKLVHPGEPPAAQAEACKEILELTQAGVVAMLQQFEKEAPVNACENRVRHLLLERWAMIDPEPAARWIVEKGNGTHREVLAWALSNLVLTNPELTIKLKRFTPEENYQQRSAILKSLAMRSHQEACEFGLKLHWDIRLICKDWLRLNRTAALAWMQPRWLDDPDL